MVNINEPLMVAVRIKKLIYFKYNFKIEEHNNMFFYFLLYIIIQTNKSYGKEFLK